MDFTLDLHPGVLSANPTPLSQELSEWQKSCRLTSDPHLATRAVHDLPGRVVVRERMPEMRNSQAL